MLALSERVAGGLMGMLIGDALGVPYEFHPAHEIPDSSAIEFEPPSVFRRSHSSVPPGTWSDDGAQALCLLASLLEFGSLDLADFSGKLLKWYREGTFTPDKKVFDCGLQTRDAFRALLGGIPPDRSGPAGEMNNGNGSLMRVLPLALWHRGSDEQLYEDARRQSLCTHGHLRSQLCCAFYCLWVRELFRGTGDAWFLAAQKARQIGHGDNAAMRETEFILDETHLASASGSGYVLNSLWSARIALQQPTYESVVRAAIAFGNDTDTTACIAGGLAGVRDGIGAIPVHWRESLRGRSVYEPALQKLLRHLESAI
jgi:ADP-ribosyl-[dinitrogen reductase] hydrolase